MFKGAADQTISEVLNGVPVTLRFKWNTRFSFWSVSIYDRQNALIIAGLKLVRDFSLLSALQLETLNGDFIVAKLYGDWDYPRFDSLPSEFILAWLDPEDVEAFANGVI